MVTSYVKPICVDIELEICYIWLASLRTPSSSLSGLILDYFQIRIAIIINNYHMLDIFYSLTYIL